MRLQEMSRCAILVSTSAVIGTFFGLGLVGLPFALGFAFAFAFALGFAFAFAFAAGFLRPPVAFFAVLFAFVAVDFAAGSDANAVVKNVRATRC